LVTGSAGHLGEAIVRTLRAGPAQVVGLDLSASGHTDIVGSVADAACVRSALRGVDAVVHTATLHKPHIVTHTKQQFVEVNVSGTLALLEEAVRAGVGSFVFTSSTSAFGHALRPAENDPAVWVTEDVQAVPKNIYGITKIAAENLCELFSRRHGLNCIVLRTSRFFPEEDDSAELRRAYADENCKANEFLFRRVDLQDVADAHVLAIRSAPAVRFDRLIVSATTPFRKGDMHDLRHDAGAVVRKYFPQQPEIYAARGWKMFPRVDRVYVNECARSVLGWQPEYDYGRVLASLAAGTDPRSELARAVGAKGYHAEIFAEGPYPVE
jgi:nucleoside-diphosphate-sugar epimerase